MEPDVRTNINGNLYIRREPRETTKRTYAQAIERLRRAGLDILDTTAVLKHLDDLAIGKSAYNMYLCAIVHTLAEDNNTPVPEEYMKKMRELRKGILVAQNGQELSDKQRDQYVPHKQLVKIAKELPMGVEKVLASLYTLTPPLRNNFGDMRVVNVLRKNSKVTGNVLVMNRDKARFVMRDYKNSGTMGTRIIPVSKEAFRVIRDWFAHLGGQPEFLLGNEMSVFSVARRIEKAFESTGKKVGINILRHAYIKEHLPPIALNIVMKQNLADRMLHTVQKQNEYYSLNVE